MCTLLEVILRKLLTARQSLSAPKFPKNLPFQQPIASTSSNHLSSPILQNERDLYSGKHPYSNSKGIRKFRLNRPRGLKEPAA
mmetsp:Transcript_3433/g.7034  ORF Transcript_3433/g.7034 Transcript_3433/m.7034 type:complete len:83 (-) Transcript_3433:176-424(-)